MHYAEELLMVKLAERFFWMEEEVTNHQDWDIACINQKPNKHRIWLPITDPKLDVRLITLSSDQDLIIVLESAKKSESA